MPRDASLDEFFGQGDDGASGEDGVSEGEDAGGGEVEDVGEAEDTGEAEGVSPAEATYTWIPAGDACVRCESEAGRLWRCDGELVCGECKEW